MTALELELSKQQGVNEELSTELREQGNYAELSDTISDLDSQLQTLKRSEQQAQQRVAELEQELAGLKSLEVSDVLLVAIPPYPVALLDRYIVLLLLAPPPPSHVGRRSE